MISTLMRCCALVLLALNISTLQAGGQRLILTGSSTVAPLALEIAKRYEDLHPGVRVDVQMGGSSRGINDVRMGVADIGMVSRALKPREHDLTSHLVARDGLGVILHASNPVRALTDEQVVQIYTGKIKNWRDVGGEDQAITVVNKAEGRSTLDVFLEHFQLKNSQIRAQVIIGDNQQGIKTVSGIPGAIGYVSIGTAQFEVGQGTPIRQIRIGAQLEMASDSATDADALWRELNFVTREAHSSLANDFIRYAQSSAVRDLIEGQFFVAP